MYLRNEHPNPQFERESWINLNGEWDFGYAYKGAGFRFSDDAQRAIDIRNSKAFPHTINVPFCPESRLSGIGDTGYIHLAWYRKTVAIEKKDQLVILHIGAADYLTTVLVNGKPAGRHRGGYTSFSFDITDLVNDGDNELFILCEDNVKARMVCRGKQSEQKKSHGCDYTRTTGIWQTVYLEYVPQAHLKSFRFYPDIDGCKVTVEAAVCGKADFTCEVYYEGKQVGLLQRQSLCSGGYFEIQLSEKHLWELGNGSLYDVVLRFGDDVVRSYFGLREVQLDGMHFLLNGKSVFQRLVLDQGFYKDGIYTAPDEEAMIKDIQLSMACGFNGARLHQKVFEPRFLYHCDRLGYMVWGEYASWGLDYSSPESVAVFQQEWGEAVARDFNHPAIIGWCPFNETWNYHGRPQYDPLLSTVYLYTKALDRTRPCIDTSGNFHVMTDIYDVHDYSFDPALFKSNYDRLITDGTLYEHVLNDNPNRQRYNGEPVMISEYGGIKWVSDKSIKSWGYGDDVTTEEEFLARYRGLTEAILANHKILGFCYTQLYDIEQEQNGLYTYKRQRKFSDAFYEQIYAVNTQTAAIEKE